MLEKIIYKNHMNEVINFGQSGIFANSNDLRNFSWSYTSKNNRISEFKRGIVTKTIPVIIQCDSEEEGIKVKNRLFECAEKDVLTMQYGRIIIGDYYLQCYVTASKKSDYMIRPGYMKTSLTVATDLPSWIKETTITSNGTFGAASGGTAIVGSAIYCQANWSGSSYAPVYGTSFTNPSSKLVKENVVDMSEEEAKKILQLKPVDFDYIEAYGGEKNQHGLIAEDTLGIIPSCVTVPEGYSEKEFDAEKGIRNKVLAIDYSKLVPYLIKMVQIQQEEIEKLKEAINKEGVSND